MSSYAYDPLKDQHELFHRLTTQVNLAENIKHEVGKASIINGDVFYSPNCAETVSLPPPVESTASIWRDTRFSNVSEFHQPLWWTAETGYLAFLPKFPHLFGEPFGELLDIPDYFDRNRAGYILDPQISLKWKRLEVYLLRLSRLLINYSLAMHPTKIIGTAISCAGSYKSKRGFRSALKQARNWFSVWMALASYAIALAMSREAVPAQENDIPEWCHFLLRKEILLDGWDQAYISGVRESLGNFNCTIIRSGIFIRVVSPPQHQFSVDWFQRFYVPVWYPWGKDEVNAAKSSRSIARLAPPKEALQAIATFLSKSPSLPTNEDPCTTQGAIHDRPWIAHFAECAERRKKVIETETPRARQSREDKERNPPVCGVRVYVWEKDKHGVYHRNPRIQKHSEYDLDEFSDTQKVYNAVLNEWDCCLDMGVDKPDPYDNYLDADFEGPADDYNPSAYVENLLEPPLSVRASDAPSSSVSSCDMQSLSQGVSLSSMHEMSFRSRLEFDYKPFYYDALELIQDFLGYVPPLPLPKSNTSRNRISSEHEGILLAILGLRERQSNCPSMAISTDLVEFLDAFNAANSGTNMSIARTVMWDLAPGNRRYLGGTRRLKCIRILDEQNINGVSEKLYLFDFRHNATVRWTLAVTNIVDALFICRMNQRMDDYEITRELLLRGIRFQTLVRDALPPPRDLPIVIAPFRLSGYIFSSTDYEAYLRQRDALLRNPRIARAAVMKGGIIWRLLIPSVSTSDVLSGPTAALSLFNFGLVLGKNDNDQHLWDDAVSNEELDQLCGTYYCYTGFGSQYSHRSWWPSFSTWRANAPTTYWSDHMEKKFQERLEDIESGNAQPWTASQWRKWVRGSSNSRRIMKNIQEASSRFFETTY